MKKHFFKEGEWLIKEQSQCSSKILSRNYLPLKFAQAGIPAQTEEVACLVERAKAISLGIVKLFEKNGAQPAFTCSKLTIETLEQGVKYA